MESRKDKKKNYDFMRYIATLIFTCLMLFSEAQHLKSYQLYNSEGDSVGFGQMLDEVLTADIILFGELHNNPICHWLQYELSTALYAKDSNLVLGAEMLEADNQMAVDLYLNDSISYEGLDSIARLWPNFETDYLGLLDFAKGHKLAFIATNIPRTYASQVFKQGIESLDTLSDSIKAWICPLPMEYDPELPAYKAMLEMMGGHGGDNFPKAQAIKDATMAHFIVLNIGENDRFIHFNGDYHSKDFEGISWYLEQFNSDLKVVTISTQLQDEVSPLDSISGGHANFTIVIDAQMTNSY
jgi:uncharacterized iron-regulated protein